MIGQDLFFWLIISLYVNHFKIISLKNDVGKVRINFQGTAKTFLTILNEKRFKN